MHVDDDEVEPKSAAAFVEAEAEANKTEGEAAATFVKAKKEDVGADEAHKAIDADHAEMYDTNKDDKTYIVDGGSDTDDPELITARREFKKGR